MNRKTRNEIEIDFSRAMDQAQELECLAADLSRIANNGVESALLVLKNSWRGDTGESMELAGKRTITEMFSTADDLIRVASTIRKTADIVYKAEKGAMELVY